MVSSVPRNCKRNFWPRSDKPGVSEFTFCLSFPVFGAQVQVLKSGNNSSLQSHWVLLLQELRIHKLQIQTVMIVQQGVSELTFCVYFWVILWSSTHTKSDNNAFISTSKSLNFTQKPQVPTAITMHVHILIKIRATTVISTKPVPSRICSAQALKGKSSNIFWIHISNESRVSKEEQEKSTPRLQQHQGPIRRTRIIISYQLPKIDFFYLK